MADNINRTVGGFLWTGISAVWSTYAYLTAANQLGTDAGEVATMIADPPIYLPYLATIAGMVFLAVLFSKREGGSAKAEFGKDEMAETSGPPTDDHQVLVSQSTFKTTSPSSFDLGLKGRGGAFISNVIQGYDSVSITDEGEGNFVGQNSITREEITPFDLPKLPDGSSELWRIDRIVSHILRSIAPNVETEVRRRKTLDDETVDKINAILVNRNEDWQLNEDLLKRLRYDDKPK